MRVAVLVALFSAVLLSRPAKSQAGNRSQFQPVTKRIYESPDAPLTVGCGAHLRDKVGRIVTEGYYALTLALPRNGTL
jgi:hypothetical protein